MQLHARKLNVKESNELWFKRRERSYSAGNEAGNKYLMDFIRVIRNIYGALRPRLKFLVFMEVAGFLAGITYPATYMRFSSNTWWKLPQLPRWFSGIFDGKTTNHVGPATISNKKFQP